jgi:NAD(P)-dependent dehydrogenase (short-subunit alcohol dehydrogenase family)
MSSSPQVFLVTGASRGLGRAIAEAVPAAGHRLVATARDPRSLDDLVAEYPDAVRAVALDVTDPDAARAAVQAALDAFGRLDVVVNNAGYADLAAVEDVTLDAFRAQIDTNLLGAGHVIQVSSVGGRMATPGLGAYQAAKWAVGGFSEVLAAEVAPLGVKVTVLEPGGMRTDWAGASMDIPPVSAPYAPTVGKSAERMRDFAATSASDPAKVAELVLRVAALDDPPVRLLVGSDAYNYGRAAWRTWVEEDARWEALSTSTDHDEDTAEQLDPLARQA